MPDSLYTLPIELQVALGGGYLAHAIAYAGLRRPPGATELALRSLAFGLGALLCYRLALQMGWPVPFAVAAAITTGVILGALWRRFGMKLARRLLGGISGSSEDGMPDAWTAIIQSPGLNVTQLSVRTTDGRTLFHDRTSYGAALHDGLYFGSDGSIMMVIDEERHADGSERKAQDLTVEHWGTRLTYLPAASIAQVNLRTPTLS